MLVPCCDYLQRFDSYLLSTTQGSVFHQTTSYILKKKEISITISYYRVAVPAKINGDSRNISEPAINKDVHNNSTNARDNENSNDDNEVLGSQPPIKKLRPVFSSAIKRTDHLTATASGNVQGNGSAKIRPVFGRNIVRNNYLMLKFMEYNFKQLGKSFRIRSHFSDMRNGHFYRRGERGDG